MQPTSSLALILLAVMYQIAGLAIVFSVLPAATKAAVCSTSVPAYQISTDEANQLYDCIEAQMLDAYSNASDVPGVPDYRTWQLVSTSPFVSATHGSLMINHFVNPVAAELYTRWEEMEGMKFPEGSILAKESFRITSTGDLRAGPLSVMEKAAPGTAPETGDWIYTRIFSDGRVQRILGPDGDRLLFCHDCHAATIESYDAMFFPPEERRIYID